MSCLTSIELGRDLPASTVSLWSDIDHFRPAEFSGHLDEMSAAVILALDCYRQALGHPLYVSLANWGGHSARSFHYQVPGRNEFAWAIDVFPDCDLVYAWLVAVKCSFWGGIGCYPFWAWGDKDLHGGLHLDIRRQDPCRSMWWHNKADRMLYLANGQDVRGLLSILA